MRPPSLPSPLRPLLLACLLAAGGAPVAPAQSFFPPPVPPGNPITRPKVELGKTLFWDEQLSSSRTVACGTCHIPAAGGSDPRASGPGAPLHPGPDQVLGTADDIVGSAGVPLSRPDGTYQAHAVFGLDPQVTGRKAPSMINAAFSPELFWDGRAKTIFKDPDTGQMLLPFGAALENQALGPLLDTAEMGHLGRDLGDVVARVAASRPLALARSVPATLEQWLGTRSYPELFAEAFGSPEVSAARIALALATYQRTLISDQTPFDAWMDGVPGALTPEQELGLAVFNDPNNACFSCHQGQTFSEDLFHYIGVRPHDADPGRAAVTGQDAHRGQMRTPGLRNVGLRGPYFHDGSAATLEDVIEFYDRGGDFDARNKDFRIRPLGIPDDKKALLATFLREALTDPRVPLEEPPFDRPLLYTESARVPTTYGAGTPGSGGHVPRLVALEPPLLGNPSFTLGLERGRGGAHALLVVAAGDDPLGSPLFGAQVHLALGGGYTVTPRVLEGLGAGAGFGSLALALPADPLLAGTALFAQWFVRDPGAPGGLAASEAVRFELF